MAWLALEFLHPDYFQDSVFFYLLGLALRSFSGWKFMNAVGHKPPFPVTLYPDIERMVFALRAMPVYFDIVKRGIRRNRRRAVSSVAVDTNVLRPIVQRVQDTIPFFQVLHQTRFGVVGAVGVDVKRCFRRRYS